jgi:hypothetical protein
MRRNRDRGSGAPHDVLRPQRFGGPPAERDGAVPVTASEAPTESLTVGGAASPRQRRPVRRFVIYGVVLSVLVAAVVAGVQWTRRAAGRSQPTAGPVAVTTATVTRTDLSRTESLSANVGYGAARPLAGRREGTVTWLPQPGASIKRGEQLYRVDDRPVPLFYGDIPLFRPLVDRNTVGRDVRVVADNLTTLGYAIGHQPRVGERVTVTRPTTPATGPDAPKATKPPADPAGGQTAPQSAPASQPGERTAPASQPGGPVTVREGDGTLTAPLMEALKKWQRDVGLPATGTIDVGDVVVLPDAVRVDSVAARTGNPANADLLSVTGTEKVVTASAEAGEAAALAPGAEVRVVLPDNRRVPAKVAAVGTELRPAEGRGAQNERPKLTVTVRLDDPATIGRIDAAAVTVEIVGETHKDVLAVPVGALVALSEGGYAVQLADGRLVGVTVGMFAKGKVEISGAGVAEGAVVVTTS